MGGVDVPQAPRGWGVRDTPPHRGRVWGDPSHQPLPF